jgi:hypothetical protein
VIKFLQVARRGHLTVRVPYSTFGIEGFNTPWLHFKDRLFNEAVFDFDKQAEKG